MNLKSDEGFIVQGHRGVRQLDGSDTIENTYPAFDQALKVGAEIELDLQVTSDHRFLIYHDSSLNPKDFDQLDLPLEIFKAPLKATQKFKYLANLEMSAPSLEELTAEIKKNYGFEPTLDFELKYSKEINKFVPLDIFTQNAYSQICDNWPIDKLRIRSFVPEVIQSIKKVDNRVETVLLTWKGRHDYARLLKDSKCRILAPLFSAIDLQTVKALREQDVLVIPFAVQGHGALDIQETPEFYLHLFNHFDGWTSDSPKKIIAEAKKNGTPLKLFNRRA